MLRLVSLGDGDEVTRRRVLRRELTALGDERVSLVLDTLGRHRLLAFDRDATTRGPTVEIAHEALFNEWARLGSWIAESRDDLRRRLRLGAAAEEWRAAGETPDYLVRGARLDELVAFTALTPLKLTEPEQAFLDASLARRDADQAAEREQRHREARLRRRSRRRTGLLIGGAFALIAASTVAVYQVRAAPIGRSGRDREEAGTAPGRRCFGDSGRRSGARPAPRAAVARDEREGGPTSRDARRRGAALGRAGPRPHLPDG